MRKLGISETAIQNRRKEHRAFADARRRSASLVQFRNCEAGFRRGRYEATLCFRRRRLHRRRHRHHRLYNRVVSKRRCDYHHRSTIAHHHLVFFSAALSLPLSLSLLPPPSLSRFLLLFSSDLLLSFFALPAFIINLLSRVALCSYGQLGR